MSDAMGRGDMRGMPLPAHPAVSRRDMPRVFFLFNADLHRRGSESGRLGPESAGIGRIGRNLRNGQFRLKFKKKKKKMCQMHV